MKLIMEWVTKGKIVVVEVASLISVVLVAAWLVWKEYQHLFR